MVKGGAEFKHIAVCLVKGDLEFLLHGPGSRFSFRLGQSVIGHQRGCGVQVENPVGIDDERATSIRVETQMDTALLMLLSAHKMVHAGGRQNCHRF
ncbi:hypothetical protein SDC9_132328 [bioreactor metagenome]|uniref:Uncharacterized protein n=1 Tax=bioreactor metagenome TaxID=1076179 RepID=A0A645D6U7_9ZZZZ